jgi:hypothetical protein
LIKKDSIINNWILVTFSAINDRTSNSPTKDTTTTATIKPSGYTINDDDDLDDLFDKQGKKVERERNFDQSDICLYKKC